MTPAGAAATWRKGESSEHINLYFDPRESEDEFSRSLGVSKLLTGRPLTNLKVPGTLAAARLLADELLQGGRSHSMEAIDCYSRLFIIGIARHLSKTSHSFSPLSMREVRIVHDYIRANLTKRLLIEDLAAVIKLSSNSFAAAFTRVAGRTPHQFVMDTRVAVAIEQLRNTRLPIAMVALNTGFSSQSHLTKVLRHRTGHTPGKFRDP